ncbi:MULTISPECIES: hypothetical protein [Cyanophyceae]|uniref:hypothetical protein n=1 Tax=Cyanophyceae TaxID=3028117 RepID=UPI0016827227|nr:hypothetical protein [Trichocoleus sp. FACHB-69]MBD1930345.1 hypothetical protein [Trichocoleus sp. FACHB-69]
MCLRPASAITQTALGLFCLTMSYGAVTLEAMTVLCSGGTVTFALDGRMFLDAKHLEQAEEI